MTTTKLTRRLAQCADGIDNDGDGLIDFPADPGCVDPADNDEVDPTPLAQCADGIDNDGDGLIDFPADPGCVDASDNDEVDPPPVVVPVPVTNASFESPDCTTGCNQNPITGPFIACGNWLDYLRWSCRCIPAVSVGHNADRWQPRWAGPTADSWPRLLMKTCWLIRRTP